MNWNGAVRGAQLGMAMGAVLGAIPLVVGCWIREYKKAAIAFLATFLAGTLGGLYAAIATTALALMAIFRREDHPRAPANQWASMSTNADKVWWIVAALWLFICVFGVMFISAAFAEPEVLSVLGYSRNDPAVKLIEPVMLFGGQAMGIVLGVWGLSFICRNLLSDATHQNLAKDMQASVLDRPRVLKWLVRRYYALLLPGPSAGLRPRK